MRRDARPDFIVMGAPKPGTTALHAALTQHPDIFMTTLSTESRGSFQERRRVS